jgi:CrcB protein
VETIAAVALGGAVGSVIRLLLGTAVQQRMDWHFPIGTLVINVTGSLLLGFFLRYGLATPSISPTTRALLTTGFCGGYTTFSTFAYETGVLIESGEYWRAGLYVAGSVVLGLVGLFLGFAAADGVIAAREAL